ncbi:hypothetical protein GW17_00054823 [Ensete ventricosum]|nr:hypothetical protein GW17_00054823 [Ensete ventricosum]
MRLNSVELFYALIAAIGSESRRCLWGRGGHMHAVCMQRWLATARPLAGAVGHGLATCKGQPTAARHPARGGHPRARSAAVSLAASRGGEAVRWGGRPLAGQLPAAKGNRRLRKGSDASDAVRVKEG